MQLNANKGEWSEFYAFLKILSDKVLHSADEALTLIPDSFLTILSVIRHEEKKIIIYEIEEDKIIIKTNNEILGIVPIFHISTKLSGILNRIKAGARSQRVFPVPEAQELMTNLKCKNRKASSSKKSDIDLRIEDPFTGTKPIRGFNIKSKIGGQPTLLNASKSTNFEYEIVLNSDQAVPYGKKVLIGLDQIFSKNETLRFVRISDINFQKNLIMIDSLMPLIVAEMLKAYYFGIGNSLEELTEYMKKNDSLQIGENEYFYEHKIKELLSSIAFGMQPSKKWDGTYETHGGYIIVKENGDLACYHVYDRDKFRDFLFLHTKFETASTKKHEFGKIYVAKGKKFIKLNFQIRFKN